MEGLRRRHRGTPRTRRAVRPSSGERRNDRPRVRGGGCARRALRGRPPSASSCGSARPLAARCTLWHCAARSGSNRSAVRYQPEEESRLTELFGDPSRVGRDVAPVPVDPCRAHRHRLLRRDRVRAAAALHVRHRGVRHQVPDRARRRRGTARAAVLRYSVPPGGCRLCGRTGVVGRRGLVPPAGRRVAGRRWITTSPTAPGCASDATSSTSWAASGRRHALPTWDDVVERLLKQAGE